jgi:hypothetical protein
MHPSAGKPRRTFDSSEQPGTPIAHIATQFRYAYNVGIATMPTISLIASGAYIYAGHSFRKLPARDLATSNMYLLAAALALAPIPYTLLIMQGTNKKLLGRAEQADVETVTAGSKTEIRASKEDSVVLGWLKSWVGMNIVRGCFPLAATVVALYATLED